MPFLYEPSRSTENNYNYLFFFYFFIGCYVACVSFLLYTLIRLLQSYLRQCQINPMHSEIIDHSGTVLLQIDNIDDLDTMSIQPLIIRTHDLPPIYAENYHNQSPPPDYKEHL
ncbi:unnamed protein product [Rotaria socialis]|uniref:Uncharacterized protein n=1 Tax=Rotaria socialis TaxID=392032 RepID=A0A818H683_9BILA|nr:unnamed protein product [Rotaria socialis]